MKTRSKLTHFDQEGQALMVDIGTKKVTMRKAIAKGRITMGKTTLAIIKKGQAKKGDVMGIARIAGIMAAKNTSQLIPLCHPLSLSSVSIDFTLGVNYVEITAACTITGQTGVEMEALSAVSVAALTIYDMVKAVDKSMKIGEIRLIHKSGGKSGIYKE